MTRELAQANSDGPPAVVGNYFDKYASRNPVHRRLVGGYMRAARRLVAQARPGRVLEVGCAGGELAARLLAPGDGPALRPLHYVGLDIGHDLVLQAHRRWPAGSYLVGSAYRLPLPDRCFDLVMACELLEHLSRPERALDEVHRVCRAYLLVSVPQEPLWRLLNLLRGRYLGRLGNTPGHVQHFSPRAVRQLVSTRFEIVRDCRPLPWTMLLARRN